MGSHIPWFGDSWGRVNVVCLMTGIHGLDLKLGGRRSMILCCLGLDGKPGSVFLASLFDAALIVVPALLFSKIKRRARSWTSLRSRTMDLIIIC